MYQIPHKVCFLPASNNCDMRGSHIIVAWVYSCEGAAIKPGRGNEEMGNVENGEMREMGSNMDSRS